MTLGEALQASEVREAIFVFDGKPILQADDTGVIVVPTDREISWVEVSPKLQKLIDMAPWTPVAPKHPLFQLAEVVDDWLEVA